MNRTIVSCREKVWRWFFPMPKPEPISISYDDSFVDIEIYDDDWHKALYEEFNSGYLTRTETIIYDEGDKEVIIDKEEFGPDYEYTGIINWVE